jgi:hypothetical protein
MKVFSAANCQPQDCFGKETGSPWRGAYIISYRPLILANLMSKPIGEREVFWERYRM